MRNIAVFASGFGSNFQAVYDAIERNEIQAKIKILISDKPNCKAVERAKMHNIKVFSFLAKKYLNKEEYEKEILEVLKAEEINLVVLAGYMRIIGNTLLKGFKGKIINIHPSLLPNFKGKDAIGQAIEARVKETGVTVHYVNEELDSGEIIEQVKLDISKLKSREEIETKIHEIEHMIYPRTIKKVLEDLNEKSID